MASSAPLDRSGSGSFSIPEIVQLAADGYIRVPTFQRHFTWQGQDIRRFFDSLYRGFPVGTLLLWSQPAPEATIALGPVSLKVPERSAAYWVVDGQQRIISLFAALSPGAENLDERFEVYFDLEKQQFGAANQGRIPRRAIPVRDALETRTLLQWLRLHNEELEPEDLDVADKLGGALRDYRIPAYIVSGDDEELLREVFDRVNSAGKPISRAQVFHALFANSDEPGSPAGVSEELSKLGFGRIDENRVVQSLLAIRGGDVQRDIRTEFGDGESPADWFDRVQVALTRAITFLIEQGVVHQLLMPNTLPLPILATFFHLHPDPVPWDKRLLARWLWRGWVHGFGQEGGQTPVLRRVVRGMNPGRNDGDKVPSEFEAVSALLEYVPDRPTPTINLNKFNTKNANSRLILLGLASQKPLGPDGSPIRLSAQFDRYGSDAVTQLVLGHRSEAAARSFWPVKAGPIAKFDDDVLRSHMISEEAQQALTNGKTEEFIALRAGDMQAPIFSFLDSRIEHNKRVRPPLSHIITDELDADAR